MEEREGVGEAALSRGLDPACHWTSDPPAGGGVNPRPPGGKCGPAVATVPFLWDMTGMDFGGGQHTVPRGKHWGRRF